MGGNAGQPGPHFRETSSQALLFWTGDTGLPRLTGGQWAASPFTADKAIFTEKVLVKATRVTEAAPGW